MKRVARQRLYWPRMNKDIKEFVQGCEVCISKGTGKLFKEVLHECPVPPRPWHTIAVDLVKLPATSDGFLYVMTVIDLFSRLVGVIPLKSKLSQVVANQLFSYNLLGSPAILLSDQGSEFIAESVRKVCKRFGILQRFVATYNPKANGTVERFNRTLIN